MSNLNKIGSLFNLVTSCNKPLVWAFEAFAKKHKMSKDSVRNLYYSSYNAVVSNSSFCTKYNIDSSKLSKAKVAEFSSSEVQNLVSSVRDGLKQGKSERAVCLELAGGDVKTMVRYLNKYRSLKNKEQILQNKKTAPTSDAKIIQMPVKAEVLTEADIQSLFMGLVRLVKNNTVKQMDFAINQKYKQKVQEVNELKQSLDVVNGKLQDVKRQNLRLQSEVELLKQDRLNKYQSLMQSLKQNQKIN